MADYDIPDFIKIRDKGGRLYYGGSQDWYEKKWMRMAGCASVAATNLAACYGLFSPGQKKAEYGIEEYLEYMRSMYRVMRPGILGFPFAGKFRRKFLRFAEKRGQKLEPRMLRSLKNRNEAISFVKSSLKEGDPIALVILRHRSGQLKHLTWHWMTITGFNERSGRLCISNYGRREYLNAAQLFEPARGNVLRMVSFHKI